MRAAGFFWKIFGGTVAVILITAVVIYLAALPTLDRDLRRNVEVRVGQEAEIAAELCVQSYDPATRTFDTSPLERLSKRVVDSRLTLIDADGVVLFDSHEDPAKMDNHRLRAELSFPGKPITRFSRTLVEEMVYVALPVQLEGERVAFARVAVSVQDRQERIADLRSAIRNGAVLAMLISLLLAWVFAQRVTQPISDIAALVTEIGAHHTTRRLDVRRDDELGRLALAVNHMADELQGQIARVERDRTEREAIFSAMADGILAVDKEQNVLFVNRPARQLLGGLEGRLKGQPVWELVRNRELLEVIERCLEKEERSQGQTRVPTKEGERVVELTAVPMGVPGGEHQGSVLELRDVTDLRRLEAVRQDFVSNVSHELKTPLTSMRGYTEAILEDDEMPEALRRSFLEKAYANTERLVAIVGDLLSLSRLQSVQHELTFEPLDLVSLAAEITEDMGDLADTKRIKLEFNAPEPPLMVNADVEALNMAISNLISNAIRYSPEDETVNVNLAQHGEVVQVEVSDHGPGIPEHEQERIFERFYRVDKARSRKLGGTGLGLAIVKNVMATHGGRVELDSKPGEGSLFRLVLDCA